MATITLTKDQIDQLINAANDYANILHTSTKEYETLTETIGILAKALYEIESLEAEKEKALSLEEKIKRLQK